MMRMKVLVHWGQEESTKVIKSTLPRSRHSNAPIHRAPLATMRHTGIQRCGSARNAVHFYREIRALRKSSRG